MEWVVTTGKSIEDAKDAALDQLGVAEDDAEFEVLDEPKLGLFGRVRTEARVRARVRPTAPRPKDDRRDRRRREQRRKNDEATAKSAPDTPAATSSRGPGSGAKSSDDPRPKSKSATQQSTPRSQPQRSEPAPSEGTPVEEDVAQQAEVARAFVAGLVEEFDLDGDVSVVEIDEDTVEIRVAGDGLGLLIGPKGQTLQAVQDLARTAVQRRVPTAGARILVDIGGYRERRRTALERFTKEQASLVVSTGEARALEPMSPADRKVVHDTVNSIDGVRTTSEGEEPRRRVVILPA